MPPTASPNKELQNYRDQVMGIFERMPLKVRFTPHTPLSKPTQDNALFDLNRTVGGMAELTPNGEFVRVNEEYALLFRTSVSEMTGKHWRDFVDSEFIGVADKAYETMQQTGRAEVQLKARRADGEVFWESVTLVKYEDAVALFSGHLRFSRDVTPLVSLGAKAKEYEKMLQLICDHAANPMFVADEQFTVAHVWGKRAEEFFGVDAKSLASVVSKTNSTLAQAPWDLVSREGLVKRNVNVIPCELNQRQCYIVEILP